MKIYRFMYKSGVFTVKEFECKKEGKYYAIENYYGACQKTHISEENVDKIKDNGGYIMWSFDLNNKKILLDKIIKTKENIMMRLITQVKSYKREIEKLQNLDKEE